MHVSLCLGKKKATEGGFAFDCLYIGQDGVALEAAALKAAASGEYIEIGRLTNPSTAPMALDPTPTQFTKPSFPRQTGRKVQLPIRPLSALEKKSQDLQRKPMVIGLDPKTGKVEKPEPAAQVNAEGLRVDGPTIEEYLIAGYEAENYPPKTYAPRDSAGWIVEQARRAEVIEKNRLAEDEAAKARGAAQQQQQQALAPQASVQPLAPDSAPAPASSAPAPLAEASAPAVEVAAPIVAPESAPAPQVSESTSPAPAAVPAQAEAQKADVAPSAPAATAASKKKK